MSGTTSSCLQPMCVIKHQQEKGIFDRMTRNST
jgi:hypothetical protein